MDAELKAEGRRLSNNLDKAVALLRDNAIGNAARAERDYRKAKSDAWVLAPEGSAKQREAWVDAQTADLRYERDIAAGMVRVAFESIKARTAQISLLQSEMKTDHIEANLDRSRP